MEDFLLLKIIFSVQKSTSVQLHRNWTLFYRGFSF